MVTFDNSKVFGPFCAAQEGIFSFLRHMQVTIAHSQHTKNAAAAKKLVTVPADGFTACPVRDVLARIGDKWSLLTVLHLGSSEQLRFNELRQRIPGISQRMLTVTLRALAHDGFVARTVFAEVPPRVEYHLTALGQSLLGQLVALGSWATDQLPAITAARQQGGLS